MTNTSNMVHMNTAMEFGIDEAVTVGDAAWVVVSRWIGDLGVECYELTNTDGEYGVATGDEMRAAPATREDW